MKSFLVNAALAATLVTNAVEAAMKKPIVFNNAGQSLHGNLYLPDSYQEGDRLPGVVVTGAWTTVKEQMPATYAAALADRGYAALVFDFRGWGESPDAAPYLEHPQRKIEDIHAAVNHMLTRPEIDPAHIAGLGICASAGYMSDTALQNSAVKSVALVAPWLHNPAIVEQVYGGSEGVTQLLEAGRTAEQADAPVIIEAASTTNENALMYKAPYYTEADRGFIPEYDNKFNVASWEPWLTYDAISTADALQTPTLLVHSDAAAIPQGAKEYARRMGDNATTLWLDDVTQFDFYDREDAVETAVDAAVEHFRRTLR